MPDVEIDRPRPGASLQPPARPQRCRQQPYQAAAEAAASPIPPDATVYAIDPARSIVTLRVYRAGRLAKLGHNHVITTTSEAGHAWTNGTLAASGFEVRVAVTELVVDEPAARAAAGADFPGELSESAREGSLGGTWDQPTVAASVTIKDQTRSIDVPLAVVRTDDAIVARGAFSIRQSDFGITPFSIGGGAIAVADAVEISFEIQASRR